MSDHPTDGDPTATDAPQDALDELDTETVEDLDADEDADDARGGQAGFTGGCRAL